MKTYTKRDNTPVVAVQLDLETDGFTYEKWGSTQRCRRRDWLVNNQGEVYTVNADSFVATYREVSHGLYIKTAKVWAEKAAEAGSIQTKEGLSNYEAGDYLVYNKEHRQDGYAMSAEKFHALYEENDPSSADD